MSEGGTVVADTGAISGSHKNVVCFATDKVSERAVWTGAVAGEGLSMAGGVHGIAHCICTGSPEHVSSSSTTDQVTGDVSWRTWL